ncbi:hypothetical protein GCM10012278_74850 [Nonomuraea glycinis]|uniref:Uncharacterized protein n=1 Tax=Nonomuraea glycinis TaxID=2047744 RepID=A0A918E8S7_9ACTN|nr:hypothetical protein GCM10012278_74850 [Nonomuraea glycinis]
MLLGDSDPANLTIRSVRGLRSTRARVVIISHTNNPAPCSRQSALNGAFVMPAIGASTTGGHTSIGPIFTPSVVAQVEP